MFLVCIVLGRFGNWVGHGDGSWHCSNFLLAVKYCLLGVSGEGGAMSKLGFGIGIGTGGLWVGNSSYNLEISNVSKLGNLGVSKNVFFFLLLEICWPWSQTSIRVSFVSILQNSFQILFRLIHAL